MALALNAGRPRSRSFEIAHRVADRFGPQVAASFVTAVSRLKAGIDQAELLSAVASGSLYQIDAALGATRLSALFAGGDSLSDLLDRTGKASAIASAQAVAEATGLSTSEPGMGFRFDVTRPATILFARERSAALVVRVSEDVREAVRIVTATGAMEGLTTTQQARAIREIVGLPPNWAAAPSNLANELRAGLFTESRRLSASDKARIRKRLREGTVDEAFIEEMQAKYSASLVNRRAMNIARTETLRSAHYGQRDAWRQATEDGVLPKTARRNWVVTPDDRLRATHAMIPGMNQGGVGLDESFDTPFGDVLDPPAEPNCRCGVALTFGEVGVL